MSADKKNKMNKGILLNVVLILVLLAVAAGAIGFLILPKITEKYPWLPMYLMDKLHPSAVEEAKGPVHVMFLFTDHFEPDDQPTMDRWTKAYREMAVQYQDADGRHPQHSWFWFFADAKPEERPLFLNQLSRMAYEGFGEIELHMHHAHDTSESFLKQMNKAISLSTQAGTMVTAEPQPRKTFAFIHGLWGLDNSRGKGACGVNNELILLRQLGCYADFTNPSWGVMHPAMVNRLYYATDDPKKPKSYNRGPEVEVGKAGVGDLFMFTGQSTLRWQGWRPVYDHGEIQTAELPTESRIDAWIREGVHVKGRPEWIFVKVFAHSNRPEDHEAVLGEWGRRMNQYLTTRYNDGQNYILHYVTAREGFNIAKAAEDGLSGNPNDFRDYRVLPYVNHYLYATAPYEAISFGPDRGVLRFLAEDGTTVKIRIRAHHVSLTGGVEVLETREMEDETEVTFKVLGTGIVGISHGGLGTYLAPEAPAVPAAENAA